MGIITGSIVDVLLEFLHKYEDKSAWERWCAVEALPEQKDASLRHGAWPNLLGIRHDEDQTYSKYLGRLNDARAGVDRVTRAISLSSPVWMSWSCSWLFTGCVPITPSTVPYWLTATSPWSTPPLCSNVAKP